MNGSRVAVAVPVPLYSVFDYGAPPGLAERPGSRVRVPFGRRQLIGIVLGPATGPTEPGRSYKDVAAVLDEAPLLPDELTGFVSWCAAYYQHPIGEAFATALPGALRGGAEAVLDTPQKLELTEAGRATLGTLPARARAQRRLLEAVADAPCPRAELDESLAGALRTALARGWLRWIAAPLAPAVSRLEAPPELTAPQREALATLRAAAGFDVTLLEGVTGSGKTELYLQRAADVLSAGRQVLVLVPEIGLTPQLAGRFTARFGDTVAAYHSGLPDGERARSWLRARAGDARIVVGTRSALFAPFRDLGLIVVDEEHDTSFKQQDGLRYSARDLAVIRAHRLGIPVILGSATPSLESLHNARSGRYRHVRLRERVHAAAPPVIRLLDVRGRPLDHGLSQPLLEAVDAHLARDGQALLFINRRGYAPVLLCHDCGWQAPCKHCDARLTLHRARGRLICHHCGAQQAVPAVCGGCGSRALMPVGAGTERIEDTLRARFPGKRVERFDSDRIRRRGELESLLGDIASGAIHILVGTQMLAKGHDFAKLSLVGILDVDQALYGGDFRALERMGQLITQVAGRAGRTARSSAGAEVVLQTHEPHHAALHALLSGGYGALADSLLAQRRTLGLPPFGHLMLLRAEHADMAAAQRFLREAESALPADPAVARMGPVPAPMERLAGRYRAQLLLQSSSRPALQRVLSAAVPGFDALPSARAVRWSVDVDPQDLF